MAAVEETVAISDEIMERFRAIDLACIGDVLGGLRLNCVEWRLKPLDRTSRMCGRAVTMRLIPLQDRSIWYEQERHPRELVHEANPGDVLVIDVGGDRDCGIWGGNVSTEDGVPAGLGGVVIDGVCRDSDDVIRTGIPTFVRGTSPLHGHGVYGTTCYMSEPVRIGGISVAPGDLMIGDADGIAVIPARRAAEIVELAEVRHELDTTPKLGTPEDSKARSQLRNKLYDLPVPPEHR